MNLENICGHRRPQIILSTYMICPEKANPETGSILWFPSIMGRWGILANGHGV